MVDIFALVAQQVSQQSPLDVIDVGGALADVGVFHVREMRGKLAKDTGYGTFGSHQLGIDPIRNLLSKTPVTQETQVNGKDVFDLAGIRLSLLGFQFGEIANRLLERVSDPQNLAHPLGGFDGAARDAIFLAI